MSNQAVNESQIVLANAIDLVSKVVLRVAGGSIASTVNGERITSPFLNAAIAAKLQAKLTKKVGA
jgi:hypothetical protein